MLENGDIHGVELIGGERSRGDELHLWRALAPFVEAGGRMDWYGEDEAVERWSFDGEALRSRARAAPIRHLALAERAQNYLAQGKKAMARKDLERILAEDSNYPNVREQLAKLSA